MNDLYFHNLSNGDWFLLRNCNQLYVKCGHNEAINNGEKVFVNHGAGVQPIKVDIKVSEKL